MKFWKRKTGIHFVMRSGQEVFVHLRIGAMPDHPRDLANALTNHGQQPWLHYTSPDGVLHLIRKVDVLAARIVEI